MDSYSAEEMFIQFCISTGSDGTDNNKTGSDGTDNRPYCKIIKIQR